MYLYLAISLCVVVQCMSSPQLLGEEVKSITLTAKQKADMEESYNKVQEKFLEKNAVLVKRNREMQEEFDKLSTDGKKRAEEADKELAVMRAQIAAQKALLTAMEKAGDGKPIKHEVEEVPKK